MADDAKENKDRSNEPDEVTETETSNGPDEVTEIETSNDVETVKESSSYSSDDSDTVTETETDCSRELSWLERVKRAFAGIFIGFILVIGAIWLIGYNENRSVNRYETLNNGSKILVMASSDKVDPANQGKLVYMTGKAVGNDLLADPLFGVNVPNGIRLERTVEMYQWTEKSKSHTEHKADGKTETKTTYSYDKTWSNIPISSSSFKSPSAHNNPGDFPCKSESWTSKNVSLGAFTLSSPAVMMLSGTEDIIVDSNVHVSDSLKGKTSLYNGGFYVGGNPAAPQIGDMKVRFSKVMPRNISIVAQQSGKTLDSFMAKNGSILFVRDGEIPPANMFASAKGVNNFWTWVLRIIGFILMFIGIKFMLSPLAVILDFIPVLGSIIGTIMTFVAFFLALGGSILVIAVAWLACRPVLGISLLVIVGVILTLLCMKIIKIIKKYKASSAAKKTSEA